LRNIARYTTEKWGEDQAVRYISGLRDCFALLAGKPQIGRTCDSLNAGLRRHEHGKHVIFYLPQPDGILVVRVLHHRMVPAKSHFEH
jgi:toxin ParE1/3/4